MATPSPTYRQKSASSFNRVRFSPYNLSKKSSLLNLTGHPHTHPNPPPPAFNLPVVSEASKFTHEGQEFVQTSHVQLDFSLFRDGRQVLPSQAEQAAIVALFPTCFGLTFCPPFLVIRCTKLPAKPWPATVAGLPLFLTTSPEDDPMEFGITPLGPKATIPANIQAWQTPNLDTIKQVFAVLDKMNANVHTLKWIGWSLIALGVSPPTTDWKKHLTPFINDIKITYIWGEETMEELAVRRKVPDGRVTDDVFYDTLRPGVMVASELGAGRYSATTSGVILESPSGGKFLTLASHGFLGGVGEHVYHPDPRGRLIGEIVKVFGHSDISLASLRDGYQYSRETFSVPEDQVKRFGKLLRTEEMVIGNKTYMDTPFNGRCEGTLVNVDFNRVDDDPEGTTNIAVGTFHYIGNGSDILLNGCCGGVIWEDNHNLIGQFRFQKKDKAGMCYSPAFTELESYGYTISEV
ncbi:MAG: hypothetical protein Q9221_008323 [Calogaya cf. arnoldii]